MDRLLSAYSSSSTGRGYWRLIRQLARLESNRWARVELRGGEQIWADLREPSVLPLFRDGGLALSTEDFFRRFAGRWSVVADVGAHVGIVSTIICEANPNVSLYAFEPTPSLHVSLQRNCDGRFSVAQTAVGRVAGTATLHLAKSGVANSTAMPEVGTRGEVAVPMTTLDEYFGQGPAPDFVKVDVEGGEYDVLVGAAGLIRSEDPPAFLLEINVDFLRGQDRSPAHLQALLRDASGRLYSSYVWRSGQLQPVDLSEVTRSNVLFVPAVRDATYSDAL